MIEVQGLYKSFDGRPVLRGVDLTIEWGQITAVIGRSGSGKSVLLKHMVGLLRPDAGKVLVDGEDVARLSGRALRRVRQRFGFLFQGGALFDSLTVFDNVAFPLREKTDMDEARVAAKVMRQLEEVGLVEVGQRFPAELSGGMRKRAALARALVLDPEIMLFDEPTTGLDPILLKSVHRSIVATQQKRRFTGAVVSHEIPEIFDVANRVAMLDEGVIVAAGPSEEIRASQNPVVRRFLSGGGE